MRLVFQPDRIPRTTTRAEWRKIDRWRRVTLKALLAHEEAHRAAIDAAYEGLAFYGGADIWIDDAMQGLINPGVVVYP